MPSGNGHREHGAEGNRPGQAIVHAGISAHPFRHCVAIGSKPSKRRFVLRISGNVGRQRRQGSPIVERELAGDEIGGLDTVRAFVNRRNARIAPVLCGPSFLDEAHAAMDLDAQACHFDSDIGSPGLDQRGENLAAHTRAGIAQRPAVDLSCCIIQQRTRAFSEGLHS